MVPILSVQSERCIRLAAKAADDCFQEFAMAIYLDNAATSWPKPEEVYVAVDQYQRQLGTSVGRGGISSASLRVDRLVDQARWRLAKLIDAEHARQLVFTYSGTDALTMALRGLLRPGDHVVTTECEHNSVLRPLRYWERQERITVTRVACDVSGRVDPRAIQSALTAKTRLVAVIHASNVTGVIQPIAEIGQLLADHPARFLVDAAQTVGHVPLSVRALGCDLLAAPCHKGLMAPTGTGFLYLAEGVERELEPLRLGGTGSSSESDEQPAEMPDRFEAGNHNAPGLVGLAASLEYIERMTMERIADHGRQLGMHLMERLAAMEHVTVYGAQDGSAERAPLLSFNVRDLPPHETAVLLDQMAGIQTRPGFHCAPRMHASLQTLALGGTVRVSWSVFTQEAEIDVLCDIVEQLAS